MKTCANCKLGLDKSDEFYEFVDHLGIYYVHGNCKKRLKVGTLPKGFHNTDYNGTRYLIAVLMGAALMFAGLGLFIHIVEDRRQWLLEHYPTMPCSELKYYFESFEAGKEYGKRCLLGDP